MEKKAQKNAHTPKYPRISDFDRAKLPKGGKAAAVAAVLCASLTTFSGCSHIKEIVEPDICGDIQYIPPIGESQVLDIIADEALKLGLTLEKGERVIELGGDEVAIDLYDKNSDISFSYISSDNGDAEIFPNEVNNLSYLDETVYYPLIVGDVEDGAGKYAVLNEIYRDDEINEQELRESFRSFIDWCRDNGIDDIVNKTQA